MKTTTSDWLYSALDQLTLHTEQPNWGKDGWSFNPIDLHTLPEVVLKKQQTRADNRSPSSPVYSTLNVTFTTSAVRARLDCSKLSTEDRPWFPKNEADLFPGENGTAARDLYERLNRTGYILPHSIFENTTHQTSIFSRLSTVICCSNETDNVGRSAVGYWSQLNTSQWWEYYPIGGHSTWVGFGPDKWPPNFAVKWIVGTTVLSNVTAYSNGVPSSYKVMQFRKVPNMSFLTCKPSIEEAQAEVVIARSSGQVFRFNLISEPQEQSIAWAAHFEPLDTNSNFTLSKPGNRNFTAKVRYVSKPYYYTSFPITNT
jgi:hypothetical protein